MLRSSYFATLRVLMHIIRFYVLFLSILLQISYCLQLPPSHLSVASAGLYVKRDASSTRPSRAILPRAILPSAPRSYLRVVFRHLAMTVPSLVYSTRIDIRLYNIVPQSLSEMVQNVSSLIRDPNKTRTWLQAWSDTPLVRGKLYIIPKQRRDSICSAKRERGHCCDRPVFGKGEFSTSIM